MDISRKTDYAIRMLSELVKAHGEIVSVRSAAEANEIPYSFARSIQHELVASGLISSVRGSHGGMRLAIDPETTSVRTVVEAIQGPIYAEKDHAQDELPGGFDRIWEEAGLLLRDFLDSVTLQQAVMEERFPMLANGRTFVAVTPAEAKKLETGA